MRRRVQPLLGALEIRAIQINLHTHEYPVPLGRDPKAADVERQIRDLQRVGTGRVAGLRGGGRGGDVRRDSPHLSGAASIREK